MRPAASARDRGRAGREQQREQRYERAERSHGIQTQLENHAAGFAALASDPPELGDPVTA